MPDATQHSRPMHLLGDLGLHLEMVGDDLHGTSFVTPQMYLPDTTTLRTSILAAWADTTLGLVVISVLAPRVPVTLELDVHLFREINDAEVVHSVSRLAKAGKSVVVATMDFTSADGEPLGVAHSLFMAQPDPGISMPAGTWAIDRFNSRHGVLDRPYAEAAGSFREPGGRAVLPRAANILNSSNTMNGGILALVVEEAALAADPDARSLSTMQLRYMRPVRTGPAVAAASVTAGLGSVEVKDANTDALAILATTRAFPR